ncbi:UNVERIFIED_CONTAM: hypothetical protein Scaly_1026200 [Sesamum calycinum]|uniref:Uncharacterized protein n=1 Tax=Sesamum calycinum TaxID=2727403 RepID=A0AAW2QJR1_9LAMI
MSPYAVLRYLPLTPCLQWLYSLRATAKHMMWHAMHQTAKGSMCHPSDTEASKYFDRIYPDFAEEQHNVRLGLCTDASDRCVLGVIDRRAAAVVACTCENVRPCHKSDFHDGDDIDVDYERLPAYGMESGLGGGSDLYG